MAISGERRFLLLTTEDPAQAGGGRALLSRLLADVLGEIAGHVRIERALDRTRPRDGMAGRLHGLTRARLDDLADCIAGQGMTDLFLDGSNLGAAARAIKRRFPAIRITTLFHNAETRFFLAALRADPGWRGVPVLAGHWRAEAMAMRFSDCRIALCERDSQHLHALFGRGADAILPMALEDRWRPDGATVAEGEPYALFVGGGFFGNVRGLEWYAQSVAPYLALRTVAVGRGLDKVRLSAGFGAGLEVMGACDDLAPWYAGARLVVAPILSGSGMKTKLAEALMHGKQVVGTREAFVGYGAQVRAANACCDDAAAMIARINAVNASPPPPFDPAQRALYLRFHAREGMAARLVDILR